METLQAADSPKLDLYTIPSYSNWFQWHNIHEIERLSLREFFDGSSLTRNPRIYKEYRDFIITKYRELPLLPDRKRHLTFTDVRKSLVGDVSVLHKVFTFLEKWGLINFEYNSSNENDGGALKMVPLKEEEEEEIGKGRVKVEEGAPYGVRVVAAPNSLKPVVPLPPALDGVEGNSGGPGLAGLAGLASYSDVYGELFNGKEVECESCKESCGRGGSVYYECTKDWNYYLCENCLKEGNYGKDKVAEDFKLVDSSSPEAAWSEAETSILLESVLKHGDDWELVAQNVKTKSKRDCISKLIQLPFGDLMLGFDNQRRINVDKSSVKQAGISASLSSQGTEKAEDKCHKLHENPLDGVAETENRPTKKMHHAPIPDASSFLMKQVAHVCNVVGPHITASSVEAAISALCYENQCSRELFDDDVQSGPSSPNSNEQESTPRAEISDGIDNQSEPDKQTTSSHKNVIPLTLRTRAATATALGAAAAHAKILADQEERVMEELVASIIDTQLKKMHCKMKYLEELELMMEGENEQMEEVESSLIVERIEVLQRLFSAGSSSTLTDQTLKTRAASGT